MVNSNTKFRLNVILVVLGALSVHGGDLRDLAWLRGKCPEGGAIVWESGRSGSDNESMLNLFELTTGDVTTIEEGWQAEFSPDGSKLAWIKGSSIRGRMRTGSTTIYTIATGIKAGGGVHWIGNDEIVFIKDNAWRRMKIDGTAMTAVAQLDALLAPGGGLGEVDVKLHNGIWIVVENNNDSYKGSDGRSGTTGGDCSTSLSPDGSFATGLIPGHDECNLTNTVSGAASRLQRTLDDCDGKGFDNHRWSSNDERFIVAQYECQNRFGVWEVGTNDVFLAGDCGGESYGDFTNGSGDGAPWPVAQSGPAMIAERDRVAFEMIPGAQASEPVEFDVYTAEGELAGVAAGETPQWCTVSIAATGGKRITITNSVSPDGLDPGEYAADVQITSSNGGSVTYTVSLSIKEAQQLPPLEVLLPNGGETISVGQQINITWTGDPQTQPASVLIYLSIDNGKTWDVINTEESIKAGSDLWGSYPWTAAESAVSDKCLIKVEDYNEGSGIEDISDSPFTVSAPGDLHLKINCGGSLMQVPGWEDDDAYAQGGASFDFGQDFLVGEISNAAPAQIYRTCRHRVRNAETGFTYAISSVPDGMYTLRLHFGDGGSARSIDISAEGEEIVRDFDVSSVAGAYSAYVIEKEITVNGGDGFSMNVGDNRSEPADVFVNGIELFCLSNAPVAVKPAGAIGMSGNRSIIRYRNGMLSVVAGNGESYSLIVQRCDGTQVMKTRGTGYGIWTVGKDHTPGLYVAQVVNVSGGTYTHSFIVLP